MSKSLLKFIKTCSAGCFSNTNHDKTHDDLIRDFTWQSNPINNWAPRNVQGCGFHLLLCLDQFIEILPVQTRPQVSKLRTVQEFSKLPLKKKAVAKYAVKVREDRHKNMEDEERGSMYLIRISPSPLHSQFY